LRRPIIGDRIGEWLKPFRRPLAVIDCASSSGPFINKLSPPTGDYHGDAQWL